MTDLTQSQTTFELHDVAEPNLFREMFPYSELPRVIFDGRNVLDARALARAGFTLHSVGRPTIGPEG